MLWKFLYSASLSDMCLTSLSSDSLKQSIGINNSHVPYLKTHKIPVITTLLDTYGSVVKVSRIEVKINNRTPWKSKRAIELISEHVDFDTLLKSI